MNGRVMERVVRKDDLTLRTYFSFSLMATQPMKV